MKIVSRAIPINLCWLKRHIEAAPSLECIQDENYGTSEGGTGNEGDSRTLKV